MPNQIRANARGYVLKSSPRQELAQAIPDVHAGRKYMLAQTAQNLAEQFGRDLLIERAASFTCEKGSLDFGCISKPGFATRISSRELSQKRSVPVHAMQESFETLGQRQQMRQVNGDNDTYDVDPTPGAAPCMAMERNDGPYPARQFHSGTSGSPSTSRIRRSSVPSATCTPACTCTA